jgi:aspartate aminotransferase
MLSTSLAERIKKVKPSSTLAVAAKAAELRKKGRDIIGLGSGEPDFDTPMHIKKAAILAIEQGQTKYTAVDGTPQLKKAIINKFKHDNNLIYEADQILVSSGGKQSFYNLCQALLNMDDEVIIPAPYWVSYPDMVYLSDATPVLISTTMKANLKVTPKQLQQAITDKTRLFVINSPSNPSGVAYNALELKALADVLLQYPHVMIATDDMYEHILWKHDFVNILNVCPDLASRTLVLNGVSKAYAMTGWRIGYAAGPRTIIQAMKKIQSQSTSNPASISQAAAVAALEGEQTCVSQMLKAFKARHDYLVEALNDLPGIHCLKSDGTFYAFPNVEKAIQTVGCQNDTDFAEYLLEYANIALVPGNAFGLPGHVRFSFAVSMNVLKEAIARLKKCLL